MTENSNQNHQNIWRANLPPVQITETPVGCQPPFSTVFGYMDGMLDAATQADLSRHLQECGECKSVLDTQHHLKDLLGKSCRTELPAGLSERVFGKILKADDITDLLE